jgi:hypothetical protein
MKSINKYISLLAIALLAISAFGSASATEVIYNNGTTIDLFYSVSAGETFITDTKLNAINILFEKNDIEKNAFSFCSRLGVNFIKFNNQVVPLVGPVPDFDGYDANDDVATFTNNTYRLFVLP